MVIVKINLWSLLYLHQYSEKLSIIQFVQGEEHFNKQFLIEI